MKTLQLILAVSAVFVITGGLLLYQKQNSQQESFTSNIFTVRKPDITAEWVSWKQKFGKSYGNDTEDVQKMKVFGENYNMVQYKNTLPGRTFKLGMTKFADLTKEEFKKMYLSTQIAPKSPETSKLSTQNVPDHWDWSVTQGVTRIKNQGQCGSCWAFSATGAIEGLWWNLHQKQQEFSEQQLVDCSQSEGNGGCQGGLMDYAFEYIKKNGITHEILYPYTGHDGWGCQFGGWEPKMTIDGYTDVVKADNDQLKAAVAKQPIAVGIAADEIQMYDSGIFNNWEGCQGQIDHGVLLVGYGADDNGDLFWKIKNSWGDDFGEKGFFRLARKEGKGVGICSVTEQASFPYVNENKIHPGMGYDAEYQ